jgi:hypothetical protein
VSAQQRWLDLWSRGVYDLGLTPDVLFALTPRQFHALTQRHERRIEHDEFMVAQLAACVINFSMAHPKEPVKPADLMPSQVGKKPKQKKIRLTKKRRQAVTETFRAGFAMLRARSGSQ